MSRLEEVEAALNVCAQTTGIGGAAKIARTLAAEVDERDEVITKLLAMLKPDKHRPSWEHDEYHRACEIAGRTE